MPKVEKEEGRAKVKKGSKKRPAMNRPDGGHTLCSDELIEKMAEKLRRGHFIKTATALVGIAEKTHYEWLRLAARDPGNYKQCVKYAQRIELALAESQDLDLERIDKAADGSESIYKQVPHYSGGTEHILIKQGLKPDWKASAWRLERRHPKLWSGIKKLELSGPDGEAIPISAVSDKELLKQVKEQTKRLEELGAFDDEDES